ncbi:MAG: glycosyltransferase family 1 protein, partial [Shimia sp.]
MLTGVDRVELAWLHALIERGAPAYGLARTRYGFVLIGHAGLAAFADAVARGQGGVAAVRQVAIARTPRFALAWMLRRHVPPGTLYLNVGHSNLSTRVLRAWRAVEGARSAVLIHDVIPLSHPQFSRPEATARFAKLLEVVRRSAEHVIYNSVDTQYATEGLWAGQSHPPGLVAHLGVALPDPKEMPLPPQPYFVTVGTIEPRKNHALLLDIWARGERSPLVIAGGRGWRNEGVFARLDAGVAGVMERA